MSVTSRRLVSISAALAMAAASFTMASSAQAVTSATATCKTPDGSTLTASHKWDTRATTDKGHKNTFSVPSGGTVKSLATKTGWVASSAPSTLTPKASVDVYTKSHKAKITLTLYKSTAQRCDAFTYLYTQDIPTKPSAPRSLSAKPGNGSLALKWSAPSSTGGATITGYRVYVSSTSSTGPWTLSGGTASGTTRTIGGLKNGTPYWIAVAAVNSAGEGEKVVSSTTHKPFTTPGAPTTLTAVRSDKSVTLSWKAPTSDGGSAIKGYTTYYSADSASGPWKKVSTSSDTSRLVKSLTNGKPYWFRVTAINEAGEGSGVVSSAITPAAAPTAPRNLTAVPANASVTLAWEQPSSTGGLAITGYRVFVSDVSKTGPWREFGKSSTSPSRTVTGLTNGRGYWFAVSAVSSAGEGAQAVSSEVKPRTTPGAPLNLKAVAGNETVTLTWTAPSSDGGASVSGYTTYLSTGSASGPWSKVSTLSSSTTRKVSDLENGTTYWFRITASNVAGEGGGAVSSPVMPATVPTAPQELLATPGNGTVALTWQAPTSDGGSRITGYNVYFSEGSPSSGWKLFSSGSTATNAQVTGLTNGTKYYFKVAAVTAIGEGAAVVSKSSVVPFTIPGAPTSLTAEPGEGKVVLKWAKPTSDGGASVTDYVVSYQAGGSSWQTFSDSVSTSTTATVTGLANGTTYSFKVVAVNAAGQGAEATISGVMPVGPFLAPTVEGVTMANSTSEQVTVSFTPGATGGRKLKTYEYSIDGGKTWLTPVLVNEGSLVTQPSAVVQTGYSYLVRAVATNNDVSPASKSVSKPSAAPTITAAARKSWEGQGANMDVTWGSASGANYYKVFRTTDSKVLGNYGPETNTMNFTLLPWNTQYGFTVAACNAGGCTSYSSAATASTGPVPAVWSVRSPSAGALEITMTKMPAGAQSIRIKICDRTASPSCDPDNNQIINNSYNRDGVFNITSVKENRKYAITILAFQKADGLGTATVAMTKTITTN